MGKWKWRKNNNLESKKNIREIKRLCLIIVRTTNALDQLQALQTPG